MGDAVNVRANTRDEDRMRSALAQDRGGDAGNERAYIIENNGVHCPQGRGWR